MRVEVAYTADDYLGEGPIWVAAENTIFWVDSFGPCIKSLCLNNSEFRCWDMPSPIGSFAMRGDKKAVVALQDGLHFFNFVSHELSPICEPELGLNTRFNDGKCDRKGRFWTGTIDLDLKFPIGSLYRLDTNLQCHKVKPGMIIPNGLGWSPDDRTMYVTDTALKIVYAYDYDLDTGEINQERIFLRDEDAFPDGLTVDAEGYVWSVKWNDWKVIRYSPDGETDLIIDMPVQRPTGCCFGGPDHNLLYVASTVKGLSKEELAEQPLAGSLFVIETNTRGQIEEGFGG